LTLGDGLFRIRINILLKPYTMTNAEFAEIFRGRTKRFVVRITKLYRALPKSTEAEIFGKQLLRSASSVGANYRAACRARSSNEFHSKISIVVEEADESCFWLEMLIDTKIMQSQLIEPLLKEAQEITSVAAKARYNTKRK